VKKKNIIIALITLLTMLLVTLTFLFYVFKEVNYDKDDFKLSIKSLFKKELSLINFGLNNLVIVLIIAVIDIKTVVIVGRASDKVSRINPENKAIEIVISPL